MTTDATVRAWCREQGIEVPERGKLNPRFHEQYREAHPDDTDDPGVGEQPEDDADETPAQLRLVDDGPDDTGETAPRFQRPGRGSALWHRAKSAARSKGAKKRVSLETTCAGAWSVLAAAAAQSGRGPTSRVLAMQAPVAGVILEEELKGTVVDKILQPLARTAATGSRVGALLGPPVLVTLLDQKPHLAPQILPVLRLALRQWVVVAGPALKAQERKQQRAMEALGLNEGDSLDELIESMIEGIFGADEEEPAAEHAAA